MHTVVMCNRQGCGKKIKLICWSIPFESVMVGLIAMNFSHFLLILVRVCEQLALLRGRCGQHSELVDPSCKNTSVILVNVKFHTPQNKEARLEEISLK